MAQEIVAKLAHTSSAWIVDSVADNIHSGSQHKECTECGQILEIVEIPATEHQFREEIVAPTCTARGYTNHICIDCEYSYKDNYVDALGHTPSDWVVDTEATCSVVGSKYKEECSACKEILAIAEIPATGHSYETTVKALTCIKTATYFYGH